MKKLIPDFSNKFLLILLIWVTVFLILEWLGVGDFAYEFGKELMKWIKSMF
jgi:hypothetical protein